MKKIKRKIYLSKNLLLRKAAILDMKNRRPKITSEFMSDLMKLRISFLFA